MAPAPALALALVLKMEMEMEMVKKRKRKRKRETRPRKERPLKGQQPCGRQLDPINQAAHLARAVSLAPGRPRRGPKFA